MSVVRNDYKTLSRKLMRAEGRVSTDALLLITHEINPSPYGTLTFQHIWQASNHIQHIPVLFSATRGEAV